MTEPKLLATFGKPFKYQVAAYRLRLADLRDTKGWEDLWQAEHDRAFMVAGATKAGILADLAAAVDKAIEQGTGLEEFKRDFRKIVAEKGWLLSDYGRETAARRAWRARLIYRTNMSTSYAAGRMAQLVAGNYPFWVYRHGASLEPREQHLAWDGLILAPDHPFWLTHAPPNGWGCSCYILGARSMAAAKILGGKPGLKLPDNWQGLDPRTGAPIGIDRGWAYSPGASVAEAVGALADRLPALPAEIGARLFQMLKPSHVNMLAERFDAFVTRSLASRIEREFTVVGALRPQWIEEAKREGVPVPTAEIAVLDVSVQHTFRGADLVTHVGTKLVDRAPKVDPLDIDWYRQLPVHLLSPRAVLLDTTSTSPHFLLIFEHPGKTAKIAVEIGTKVKKAGGQLNIVKSGRLVEPGDLASLLGRGVRLIEGEL